MEQHVVRSVFADLLNHSVARQALPPPLEPSMDSLWTDTAGRFYGVRLRFIATRGSIGFKPQIIRDAESSGDLSDNDVREVFVLLVRRHAF